MMADLHEFEILKEIDSNNVLIISKQQMIIVNLEKALENRDNVIRAKDKIITNKNFEIDAINAIAKRDKWIIGGVSSVILVTTLLSTLLTR